jgi:phosphoribulokinase
MPRPIILGVVGDSAAGKTTMTRGLVRILGEQQVTAVSTDDYHRYDRKQRAERQITPLHPDCNYLDIMSQHLGHLRRGEPILKPVYVHLRAARLRGSQAVHDRRGPARIPHR